MDDSILDKPKVSVVIPNFNYAIYLKQCLQSVMNQTYSNLEIILVDDGSTDNSVEVASQFGDRLKIISQANLGVNAARNNGIRYATGDYIAICDSDDFWENSKIERQMEVILKNPQCILVYCSYFRVNQQGRKIEAVEALYSGYLADSFIKRPTQAIVAVGSSTALFRKTFKGIDMFFDETLRGNGEDWDFFRRISKYGTCEYVSEPLSSIREHNNQRSKRELTVFYEGNRRAMQIALSDKDYRWNRWTKFLFMFRFEIVMAKAYASQSSFFHALSHLAKAFLPKPS